MQNEDIAKRHSTRRCLFLHPFWIELQLTIRNQDSVMKRGTPAMSHARRHGLIALAISNALAGTALAQAAPPVPAASDVAEDGTLDTVLVTGARATGRTVRNS